MKLALLVVALLGCKRPVERRPAITSDARVADAALDGAIIEALIDAAPTELLTTVIQVNYMNGSPFLVLAAGAAEGVQRTWQVTIVVDGPAVPPRCTIVRVAAHETECKLEGTRLPSKLARIAAPQPAD
jgi:hypothetical protein